MPSLPHRAGQRRSPVSSHRRRTWLAGALAGLLVLAGTAPGFAGGATAAAAPTPEVASVASWLAGQLTANDGLLSTFYADGDHFSTFVDYGLTADAVLAQAATGEGRTAAAQATTRLETNASNYIGDGNTEQYAGATAKLALVAEVQGADPTDFGGHDLIAQLQGLQVTSGAATGRFVDRSAYGDYSNSLSQSLAIIALERHGAPVDDAVAYLQLQQCPAGGVRLTEADTACTDDSTADPDVTGLALQAFVAAGSAAAADEAAAWLMAQQAPDGSFKGAAVTATPNANSTGVIAAGLAAHGDMAALQRAQGYLRSLQLGCAARPADRGAIAYDPSSRAAALADGITTPTLDQFRRATTQAVLGLAGVSYVTLDASSATPLAPPAACTTPLVTAAYGGVLDRAPDPGGRAYWQQRLEDGTNPLVMVAALASSAEAARQVVTVEYRYMLNRGTDPGGLSFWSGVFQRTHRADLLAAELVASPERFTADGGQTWQWVQKSLYETILGREPDPQGLLYWTDQANKAGPAGRARLVPAFLYTDEGVAVVVRKLYGHVCDGAVAPQARVEQLAPGFRATNLNPVLTRTAIVFGGC